MFSVVKRCRSRTWMIFGKGRDLDMKMIERGVLIWCRGVTYLFASAS